MTTFLSITKSQMMALKLFRMNAVTIVNVTTLAFLMVMTVGSSSALAQVIDPSLEVFRIRCQIDADVNPATGVLEPKVQIQGKARADLLDGAAVDFGVQNLTTTTSLPPNVVSTVFELGSATADWDTFPDATDPTPVTTVDGDFVVGGESIRVTAKVKATGQTVTGEAECADKTSSQFKQDTKGVCKLKDFLRDKCKSGDILPDGTVMP